MHHRVAAMSRLFSSSHLATYRMMLSVDIGYLLVLLFSRISCLGTQIIRHVCTSGRRLTGAQAIEVSNSRLAIRHWS
ncbi:hypothetical protein BC835DRAFT_1339301 [Cytidiella melzeri]|nr:hypothetical protein BC835DRAFT_1339301 [Cytidiella melzeri]